MELMEKAKSKASLKKTEVGLIPDDWKVVKLGKVLEFKNGLNKESEYFGYGTPIVNYMDVFKNAGIKKENIEGKVFVTIQEQNNFSAKKGDVFFTRTSETQEEIGVSAVLLDDIPHCVFSGFILRGRAKTDKLLNEYKQYCFSAKYVREQIVSRSSYTTRALTNGRHLSEIQLAVPSTLEEQKAIATALSDVDNLISSLEKTIAKKKAIKQGAMQQLLTPPHKGGKRLPGFSGEWEETNFDDICWYQEGPGLRKWQFTNKGMKVINVTNLVDGYLELTKTERHISIDEFKQMYRHFEIDENDIVVASSGNSYCKTAVVRKQDLPLLMNTSVIRFKPKEGLNYGLLLIFLKSKIFKDQIDLLITGGAQPNFGPAHLRKIKFTMPTDIEEQRAISNVLLDIDEEIELLEAKKEKYKKVKQGMMQELLTGKTRMV